MISFKLKCTSNMSVGSSYQYIQILLHFKKKTLINVAFPPKLLINIVLSYKEKVPNGTGFVLGAMQLVLYGIYRNGQSSRHISNGLEEGSQHEHLISSSNHSHGREEKPIQFAFNFQLYMYTGSLYDYYINYQAYSLLSSFNTMLGRYCLIFSKKKKEKINNRSIGLLLM